MNLLPAEILYRRQIYAECRKFAAVQVAIFLLMVIAVFIFDYIIAQSASRTAVASSYLYNERFTESEAIARKIQNHNERMAAQRTIETQLNLSVFDIRRLQIITETLPVGVFLLDIDINEYNAVLTVETTNLALSDTHREALTDTGLVSGVKLASVIITEDGTAQYTLMLLWKQNE